MGHIYISYRQEEGAFVTELARQLEGAGFQVWGEDEALHATEGWRDDIDQAIREAFALIVVLTPAARAAEQIMYEWTFALGVGVRVIVVVREPGEIHPRLEPLPRLDFDDPAALPWGRLIRLVQDAADAQRRPAPGRPLFTPRPSPLNQQARRPLVTVEDGTAQDSVARLIERLELEEDDGESRINAARRLGERGDRSAIPALIRALRADDFNLREAAAVALGKLRAASAVVGLLEALRWGRPGPFGGGSTVFLNAIREIGPAAVPVLIDALNDEEPRMRLHIVDLLRDLGDPEAVLALTAALRDPEWRVRWKAADALGRMGSLEAVPDLVDMLSDSTRDVQISAAWALGRIGAESAVNPLIRLLRDREWRVRWAAAEALWQIGEKSIPALVETLRDPDEYVRRVAIRALAEIGQPAIAPLIDTLADANWDVRWSAASALQEIGNPAVAALVRALEVESWQAAWAAAETLKRIGTPEALSAFETWRKGREMMEEAPE